MRVSARNLPGDPLDAAAAFHATIVPNVREAIAHHPHVAVCFNPADHAHRGWRLAAIQELAREAAPGSRVNAVVGCDEETLDQVFAYLENAPGITGQILKVAGVEA